MTAMSYLEQLRRQPHRPGRRAEEGAPAEAHRASPGADAGPLRAARLPSMNWPEGIFASVAVICVTLLIMLLVIPPRGGR
ncbi:MAG: hypothetical protein AB7U23_10055 [Dehalococcoidia bacterium]